MPTAGCRDLIGPFALPATVMTCGRGVWGVWIFAWPGQIISSIRPMSSIKLAPVVTIQRDIHFGTVSKPWLVFVCFGQFCKLTIYTNFDGERSQIFERKPTILTSDMMETTLWWGRWRVEEIWYFLDKLYLFFCVFIYIHLSSSSLICKDLF